MTDETRKSLDEHFILEASDFVHKGARVFDAALKSAIEDGVPNAEIIAKAMYLHKTANGRIQITFGSNGDFEINFFTVLPDGKGEYEFGNIKPDFAKKPNLKLVH